MKNRICKITALCLVLCLVMSAFCACTQNIQIRFVDKDGNNRFTSTAADTAQTAAPTGSEPVSQTPEGTSADNISPESTTAAQPEGFPYKPLNKKGTSTVPTAQGKSGLRSWAPAISCSEISTSRTSGAKKVRSMNCT